MNNYSPSLAVDALNTMNHELQALNDKYLELAVRAHILEVDLATQFSPDMVLALEELEQSCEACKASVEQLVQYSVQSSVHQIDEIFIDDQVLTTKELTHEGDDCMLSEQY